MVTGSVAVIVYGEPRLTHDVDIVVDLDADQARRLPEVFEPSDYYCPPSEVVAIEIRRAQRGHFNIIHHKTGFKADMYPIGNDALHQWGLAHTKRETFRGETIVLAPPEYVITRKLEFFREGGSDKHVRDVQSMWAVSRDDIDIDTLSEFLNERGLIKIWHESIESP